MEKQTAIIIPARYGSSRLEGKPLLKAGGKYIIQWVWEKCIKCKGIDRVIVATDDERIFNACKEFGAEVEMTSTEHKSGSDRIAEVAKRHSEIAYIINVQGDEPLIEPDNIELVRKGVVEDAAVHAHGPVQLRVHHGGGADDHALWGQVPILTGLGRLGGTKEVFPVEILEIVPKPDIAGADAALPVADDGADRQLVVPQELLPHGQQVEFLYPGGGLADAPTEEHIELQPLPAADFDQIRHVQGL